MKLSVFLILLTSFHAMAYEASSQARINLNVKGLTIQEIVKKIESKYSYRFVYNDEVVQSNLKLISMQKTRLWTM